ncbi:tripartite motif-containing protein 10-like [Notechis scutatus]|uniref:Tripartite motif-containing protein 10-like n=1 Tax=Notechis scutatus TaxID=8663 RepID=A0A6J1W1I4_9SAUR|nr:tripartite motif-containing protein 10-like [Notechis scutatus]
MFYELTPCSQPTLRVSVPCPAVYVTLNSSTTHPQLLCQGSTVTWTDRYQECPDVPERFDREFCVLGSEGFTTGWHWWKVSVQGDYSSPLRGTAWWAVEVAKESIPRKRSFQLSPQEGIWAVGTSVWGVSVAFQMYQQRLSLRRPLRRLWVRLDCEARKVEFLDAATEASLYTFQMGPLLGETLRPFFYLGKMGLTLQCEEYPVKIMRD